MYHSVRIPFVPDGRTQWHPTEPTGPFGVLVRGAFPTIECAHAWARTHLAGHPYTLKEYPSEHDVFCPARIESFMLGCVAALRLPPLDSLR